MPLSLRMVQFRRSLCRRLLLSLLLLLLLSLLLFLLLLQESELRFHGRSPGLLCLQLMLQANYTGIRAARIRMLIILAPRPPVMVAPPMRSGCIHLVHLCHYT